MITVNFYRYIVNDLPVPLGVGFSHAPTIRTPFQVATKYSICYNARIDSISIYLTAVFKYVCSRQ